MSGRRACVLASIALVACGARTALDVPEPVAPCAPTEETCNGVDDDCDGATDEGLGFGLVAGPFEVATEPTGYFTSDLVVSGGGMVGVWNVGFDGSHPPVTNAFSRRLDADGHALAEAMPILGRPVTTGITAEPSRRGIVLTYCGRFGADDVAASAFLDAMGAPLGGEVPRGDGMRSCGAVPQSGIDSGVRHLFAWITNGGPSPDGTFPIFLDVADDAGVALAGRVVEERGDLYTRPSLARHAGTVALTYGVRPTIHETAIDLVPLSLDGSPLGATTRLGRAPVEERSFGEARVVSSAEGFLVMASDPSGPGLYRARAGTRGELVAPLESIEASGRRFEQLDLAADASGTAFVVANAYTGTDSTLVVARLDQDGRFDASWEGGAAVPYALVPSIAVEDGRLFLLSGNVDGHTLEIREFGCTR